MPGMNVRRLAAGGMYGTRGAIARRPIIAAEFIAGAVVLVAFGAWLVSLLERHQEGCVCWAR